MDLGHPGAGPFGVGAFAFNVVPYVGAIAGVLVSALVAFVTLDGFAGPVLVAETCLMLTSAEGQFVPPYFVAQRLQLNTVVEIVAVALFAWLWSVVGMIVAAPLLVVLNVRLPTRSRPVRVERCLVRGEERIAVRVAAGQGRRGQRLRGMPPRRPIVPSAGSEPPGWPERRPMMKADVRESSR